MPSSNAFSISSGERSEKTARDMTGTTIIYAITKRSKLSNDFAGSGADRFVLICLGAHCLIRVKTDGRRSSREAGRPCGPTAGSGLPGKGDGLKQGDGGAGPRWREEQWRSERGLEYRDRWEGTRGAMRPTDGHRHREDRWVHRRCYSPEPRGPGRL